MNILFGGDEVTGEVDEVLIKRMLIKREARYSLNTQKEWVEPFTIRRRIERSFNPAPINPAIERQDASEDL